MIRINLIAVERERTRKRVLIPAAHRVTIGATFILLGTALLMQWAGMSMALGAFLAGVLLAESNFRHELEADIEPFRGILLGLFFLAAIASGFTATAVFPMPYKAQEAVGRMTVDAALAWFFLSVVIQGKWLTFKRSLYLAVALYCAFLIFVFAQLLVGAPQH